MDGAPETPRLARRANEIRVLEQVSTELNSVHELEPLVELLMDTLARVFGVQHCSVFLTEPDDGADQSRASAPRLGRALLVLAGRRGSAGREGERVHVGSGIVGTAAAKGEVVRLNFRKAPLPLAPDSAIESHMAVPMLAQGDLVGVLKLEAVHEGVLSLADEQLAGIVANQAAVAIENARLYQRQKKLNDELEQRVRERTAELEQRHRELQQAQAQLVQSGKLAVLGQIAAGLTHEINTPLGAINASIGTADKALALLRDAASPSKTERALAALQSSNELIRAACERVFSVFGSLRRFARLDESELQWAKLDEGLEATLDLLSHRIDGRVEVVRRYGELPDVRCFAGEINQVLLVVVTNALDALDARGPREQAHGPARLTLALAADGDEVSIEIADNGVGVAPDRLARIFEPGFSTKGARVGAGMSLAAAFRIMEEHHGSIAVESELGRGTRLSLRLPVAAR